MSSKRWDKDEKEKLIKMYSDKKSFEEIAEELDRSESAIRLRLETIIYDGIAKGIKPNALQKQLNTNLQAIMQMFYTHRSFKESKGEDVISLDEVNRIFNLSNDAIPKSSKTDKSERSVKSVKSSKSDNDNYDLPLSTDPELIKLEKQNRIMKSIIDKREIRKVNRDLKKKIKKLHKNNELSSNEIKMLESLL